MRCGDRGDLPERPAAGHRQRLQPAGPDVLDRRRQCRERRVDMAADQIAQRRAATFIGDVDDIDAGQVLEDLGGR